MINTDRRTNFLPKSTDFKFFLKKMTCWDIDGQVPRKKFGEITKKLSKQSWILNYLKNEPVKNFICNNSIK